MDDTSDIDAAKRGRGNARDLIEYWVTGPGGREIKWGVPGDFDRCVRRVGKYMTSEQAKGFCNLRHHDALGIYPAEHK